MTTSAYTPTVSSPTPATDGLLVSYLTLRRIVGILGVALPVVLALWGFALCACVKLEPSISDYYSIRPRDALVGFLFAIASFLFTYTGYERKDAIAGKLACVFALGVALFPNGGSTVEKTVHYISAAALFLVLAYFSLFLFTKSAGARTRKKQQRNVVYTVCGVVMLVCIGGIAAYQLLLSDTFVASWKPVFWLEALALWAFGISWFIKGETLLKDPP
jgi:hypothetical protein